jgi:hypothetical protein
MRPSGRHALWFAALVACACGVQSAYDISIHTAEQLLAAVNNRSTDGLLEPVYLTLQSHLDLRGQPSAPDNSFGEVLDPIKRNLTIRVRFISNCV